MLRFNDFKVLHSEIIMWCQIIENDLKWIYSFMHRGNTDKNYKYIKNKSLGYIVNKLQELDNLDNNLYISNEDYEYLKMIKNKRNFWAHNCYIEFMYCDNFMESREYKSICEKLEEDHSRLKRIYELIENLKIEAKECFSK